jgi:hypothetical protein
MRHKFLPLLLLIFSCSATNRPQEAHYGPIEGESIYSLGGTYGFIDFDDSSKDQIVESAQFATGHFLSDTHEWGVQANWLAHDFNFFEIRTIGLFPYFNFNFQQSERTWFYVGPHAGYVYVTVEPFGMASTTSDEISYGAQMGIRHWLTPSVSIFAEPRITQSSSFETRTILMGLNFNF